MKHTAVFLLLCAFLMGCESASNPFNDTANNAIGDGATDDGTDGGTDGDGDGADGGTDGATGGSGGDGTSTITDASGVPAGISGNVSSIRFDAASQTLTVIGLNLDNTPVETAYTRTPALDQDGFIAFTTQDDPLDRQFTAFVAQRSSVTASTAASATPRNRTFRGSFFQRDGAYDPPAVTEDSGLVTYAGTYVGLTNIGDTQGDQLLSTNVTPNVLQPGQSLITDGDVLLNADFADNQVEGNIFNRRLRDSEGNNLANLPALVLIVAPIDSNGQFEGSVEYDVIDPASNTTSFIAIGDYAGIFGGENAGEVAGGVNLSEFDGAGDPLGFEAELESGAFILDACNAASSNPICAQLR